MLEKRHLFLIELGFSITILLFYFKVFFIFDSYIQWGNFYLPFSKLQVYRYISYIFWNPYYSGEPNLFPSTTIVNTSIFTLPFSAIVHVISIGFAVRIFFFVSSLFLLNSFFIFSGKFSSSVLTRTIGSMFFLYNPFQIDQLSAGDFLSFWSQGFLLLSLTFLMIAIKLEKRSSIPWIISFIFLYLTIGIQQFTYLGIVLYLFFGMIYFFKKFQRKHTLWISIRKTVVSLLILFPILLFVFAPFILPTFVSFISLGPASPLAPSISSYSGFTTNFLGVIFLQPYPGHSTATESVMNFLTPAIFLVWTVLLDLLMGFLLIYGLIRKDITSRSIAVAIIFSSILGAGTHSPLGFVPEFLYLHMPGYQLLNTSYYWDWVIIAPLYSVLLMFITDGILDINKKFDGNSPKPVLHEVNPLFRKIRHSNLVKLSFVSILIFVVVAPIGTQGYYGTNGIVNRGSYVPSSYVQLADKLINLTDNNGGGVALFPPGPQVYYNISKMQFTNSLYVFSPFEIAYPGSYENVPTATQKYFQWIYETFYDNQTTSLGQLMAMAGIKYFVVLNGANNYPSGYSSRDPISLMGYQKNVTLMVNTTSYSIFLNNNSVYQVQNSANFTIIIGTQFSAFNQVADNGYNLVYNPVFTTNNINSNNYMWVLQNTSRILLGNISDINYLALNAVKSLKMDSTTFLNNSNTEDSATTTSKSTWVDGANYYVPQISNLPSSPNNFVFTNSFSSLNITVNGNSTYNKIYAEVYYSPLSANLSVSVNNRMIQTIACHEIQGNASGFRLVPINYTFENKAVLEITPLEPNMTESIGTIYLVNNGSMDSVLSHIKNIIVKDGISVFNYNSVNTVFQYDKNIDSSMGLNISDSYSGYIIKGPIGKFLWVNYGYYGDQQHTSNGAEFSIFDGVNTLIISSTSTRQIRVTMDTYTLWAYGTLCQIITFLSLISAGILIRKKGKLTAKLS